MLIICSWINIDDKCYAIIILLQKAKLMHVYVICSMNFDICFWLNRQVSRRLMRVPQNVLLWCFFRYMLLHSFLLPMFLNENNFQHWQQHVQYLGKMHHHCKENKLEIENYFSGLCNIMSFLAQHIQNVSLSL